MKIIDEYIRTLNTDSISKNWFETIFKQHVIKFWSNNKDEVRLKFKKLIMKIKTNSIGVNDPKTPDLLFSLFKSFAKETEVNELYIKYINGISWKEVKDILFNYIENDILELYDSYHQNIVSTDISETILKKVDDTYKWIRAESKNKYDKYGYQLRSCIKNYYNQVKERTIDIHILLYNNRAVVSLGILNNEVIQIKGYKNNPVDKKHWNIVREYIKQWNNIKQSEYANIGMIDKYNKFEEYIDEVIIIKSTEDINLSLSEKIHCGVLLSESNIDISNSKYVKIDNAVINGNLYCRNCKLDIKQIIINGNLFASGLKNEYFDYNNIKCKGSIYLQNSKVKYFNYTEINGDLCIDNTEINLDKLLYIEGNFYARNCFKIINIPPNINGSIIIPNTNISKIKKNLNVYGDLDISSTPIKQLKNVTIYGNLYIMNTLIKKIDKSVDVRGVIFLNQEIEFENKIDRLVFQANDFEVN